MKFRGKLPPSILFDKVVRKLPTSGEGVLLGPSLGEDAAILQVNEPLLAIHSDPVTGGGKLAGWLSVYVASNDIATRGLRPKWLLVVMLFREGAEEGEIMEVVGQVGEAAKNVGAAVVGGHTEVTPGLPFNVVITTAMGAGSSVLNTKDAEAGDILVLTKDAALEGTSILATELSEELGRRGVSSSTLKRASAFINDISIVNEAMLAAEGGAKAMHDPTEGGLLGGVQEMALASDNGFLIYEDRIPLRKETLEICEALGIDPLRLISSGSLLISVDENKVDGLIARLREKGIDATPIGKLTDKSEGMRLVRKGGTIEEVKEPVIDELWRILAA